LESALLIPSTRLLPPTSAQVPTDTSAAAPNRDLQGVGNWLRLYNDGSLGKYEARDLVIGDPGMDTTASLDPLQMGTFVLAGDSSDAGVVFLCSLCPDFRPYSPYAGVCPFAHWREPEMGKVRVGGCPGIPWPIAGEISVTAYTDNPTGTYADSAGVDVTQTAVAAHSAPYGDFIIFRWEITNYEGIAKGPWYAGTFIDWDAAGTKGNDDGRYSDSCNGYFIWDVATPDFAYGMLDPNQPTRYFGADPTRNPPYRIAVYREDDIWYPRTWDSYFSCCDWGFLNSWSLAVRSPLHRFQDAPGFPDARIGMLYNAPIDLAPFGSAVIYQAMFWVDATSNDPAVMESNAVGVAHRAARWAGFARGDVNDDGFVDLADVCWLKAGLPIYPDQYCGDVDVDGDIDAADIAYLLNYVSGLGPAPRGAWRFTLPPSP
jgi:hypothetical protein